MMSTNAISARYATTAEADEGRAFTTAVLICLLLLMLPIKNSAYLIPPAFIALMALGGNVGFLRRAFLWGTVAICVSSLSILADSFAGQNVNGPGVFIGLLTYAQLAVLVALRSNFAISPAQLKTLTLAVAWFVIVQSSIGLLQYALSGNPDAICGTFGLLDFGGSITIGQVYLTFNLFAMILFLWTVRNGKLVTFSIALGLFTCAVAHSGHQTLSFIASVAFVGLLQLRLKDAAKLFLALATLTILAATLSSIYWTDLQGWYRKVVLEQDSPKRMATQSAIDVMSAPKNLLLGVGIGQYGSRAALITSDNYLAFELPPALQGESEYFHRYIRPALVEYSVHGEGSAMSKPYSSALNVIVEFGLPLTAALLIAFVIHFMVNWRLSRSHFRRDRSIGIVANAGLMFFLLCCFIENYIEFPQAVLLPALLYFAARTKRETAQ
jgi:hypothetical protein